MEVVKFLRLDVSKQLAASEMLSWTQAHSIQTVSTHKFNELNIRAFTADLTLFGHRQYVFFREHTHLTLKAAVRVGIIRRVEVFYEPSRLRIWYLGDVTRLWILYMLDMGPAFANTYMHFWLLTFHLANNEVLDTSTHQHFN